MRSRRPSLRILTWSLLAALFFVAGAWYFNPRGSGASQESGYTPGGSASADMSSDASKTPDGSAAQGIGAAAAVAAPSAGATPAGAAVAGAPALPGNPLPLVAQPYELEPELDLSTHYALIKGQRVHPYKLIARYKAAAAPASRSGALGKLDLRASSQFPLTPDMVVIRPVTLTRTLVTSAQEAEALGSELMKRVEALAGTGQFEYVEPDYIRTIEATPSDQSFTDGTLWGLRNTGQSGGVSGADIDAVRAWDTTTGSASVLVAVIDTGVRYTHQDLSAQMWRNPDEIAANGIDDDQDGYIDNIYGINGITNSGDPMDDHGHGTHCSGTIGAQANGGGPLVGVAWSVKIMACRFMAPNGFGGASGSTSDAIKCINFAVVKGAHILSNSWGGGSYSQALSDAITAANASSVLFVASAGNSSTNTDTSPAYPASYAHANIISVAALDRQDQLASFSNFGATSVDIGAPGVSIYSSTSSSDTSYASYSGTSMAAPHVAGVAALILARSPELPVAELRQRIFAGAVPISSLTGLSSTGARLNAHNALTGEPDGTLEINLVPVEGTELTGGATVPVFVHVRDFDAVTDAAVTGTAGGSTAVTFVNNGTGTDATAGDNIYSGSITLPVSGASFELQVQVSAPGKTTGSVTASYAIRQPPANDLFASRAALSGASATATGHNIGATRETGEPYHYTANSAGKSVWWTWTAPANGTVAVRTTGSNFDTTLAVYTGASVNALTEIVSNDQDPTQSTGARTSRVQFNVTSGTTYHVAVDGLNDGLNTALGSVTVNFTLSTIILPPNDLFALRTNVTSASATLTGSNVGATAETGEPYHYSTSNKSVWWSWTAPSSGSVLMRVTGADFIPVIAVYTGTSLPSLTHVAQGYANGGASYTSAVYFSVTAGTTYQIAIDSLSTYSSAGPFTLEINPPIAAPVIATQPAAQTRYPGDSIYLYVYTEYSPVELSYQWKKNGVNLTDGGRLWGSVSSSLSISSAEIGDTGSYTVAITNAGGATLSAAAAVTVSTPPAPVLSSHPISQNVYIGESLNLFVSSSYTGTTTFQWQKSTDGGATFTDISGATSSYFSIYNTQPSEFARYRVIVTNAGGTVTSNSAVITPLTPAAPVISTHPASASIQGGSSLYLSGYATGRGNITYRWQKDGVDLVNDNNRIYGATSSYLQIYNILLSDAGQYRFVVTNAGGSVTSNAATVTVTAPPAPVILSHPSSRTVTAGYSTSFYIYADGVGLRYQWQKNGVNLANDSRISGATSYNLNINNALASDAGQYRVVVTNEGGTATSAAAALTVNLPLPPTFYSHPTGTNVFEIVTFSLSGYAYGEGTLSYQWYKDGVAIPDATSSYYSRVARTTDAGRYKLAATNSGGTTYSNEAEVVVTPGSAPAFIVQPAATAAEAGDIVILHASATGMPAPAYSWYKNGVLIPGAASTSISFNAQSADNGATYRASATNLLGTADSTLATLTVHAAGSGRVLGLTPATRIVGAGRVVYPLTIHTHGDWTAAKNASWIALSTSSGTRSRTLEITVAPNPLPTERTATITLDGKTHTLTQRAAGTPIRELWAMGENISGQLGDGSLTAAPFPIYATSGIANVYAADDRSFLLKTDGTLWAMGDNRSGQLGDGTTITRRIERQVATSVRSVSCGFFHTLILKTDGTLWACGQNTYGQLGDGTFTRRPTPVQVATNVLAAAAGSYHSVILKTDGTLWTCGDNYNGQLGDGSFTNRFAPVQVATGVRSMAAGSNHTLFVKNNDSLWAMGNNSGGQFGVISSSPVSTPIQLATGVKSAAAAASSTFILKNDDTVWACGSNFYGQLGDGGSYIRYTPAQIATGVRSVASGPEHTLLLKLDGTLWGCGDNLNQEVGDGSTLSRSLPVQIATSVAAAAVGADHSLFVKTDGTVWIMGSNAMGQLGQFRASVELRSTPIGIASEVQSAAAGVNHSLFVKTDGTAWSAGGNYYGQLGDGSATSRTTPLQVFNAVSAVSAGSAHSLFLNQDGALHAVGGNDNAQLGDGTYTRRTSPVRVATAIAAMSSGSYHSLARKTGGSLVGFGSNYSGQLGGPHLSSYTTPFTIFATGGGTVHAGANHSFFVKTDGTLWATGSNTQGQLGVGNGSFLNTPAQIAGSYRLAAAGSQHSLVLLTDGSVRAMGWNHRGQLGDGTFTSRSSPTQITTGARALAAGGDHGLVIKDDNSLWAFGDNSSGQLGLDSASTPTQSTPVRVAANVENVVAGNAHTLFIATGDPRVSAYTSPVISGFSPVTPIAGATVTITGTGFTDVAGVYFNQVAATSYTTVSPTQITAVAPDTALANLTITVGTFDGVATQNNPGTTPGDSTPPPVSPPAPVNPPATGGSSGGGGGAPSLWFFAALVSVALLRRAVSARRIRILTK